MFRGNVIEGQKSYQILIWWTFDFVDQLNKEIHKNCCSTNVHETTENCHQLNKIGLDLPIYLHIQVWLFINDAKKEMYHRKFITYKNHLHLLF